MRNPVYSQRLNGFIARSVCVCFAIVLAALSADAPAARADGLEDAARLSQSGPVAIGGMFQDSAAWKAWRRRFVSDAGRIVDTGNGAFSHSEGQGYGLLLAAAAGDRATFDRTLTWTTLNLHTRNDNLAAWRWTGGPRGKQDLHNASDGDILIAWALAEAADFWNDAGYLAAAQAMTADIVSKLVKPVRGYGSVLMPGAEGFGRKERPDGPIVNLSYWVFPAFYRLAQIQPTFDWAGLMQSGVELIGRAQQGPAKLPPDWLSLAKATPAPAQGFETRFGYDALRIPLYLYWTEAVTPAGLSVFDAAWPKGAALVGSQGADARALNEPGYQAVAALLECSCRGKRYPESFYRFSESQNYYPATLHLLSVIAATMRGGSCLDSGEMRKIVAHNWIPRIGSLERLEADLAPPPAAPAAAAQDYGRSVPIRTIAPAAEDGAMPQDADLFSYLRVIAGAFTVLAGLYYLLARAENEPDDERADDHGGSSATRWRPAPGQYDIVPRTLPENPFSASSSLSVLAREIETAIEASVRLSRTVGLIYWEFPALAEVEEAHGAEAADALIESLAQDFRRALRGTDNVAILNRKQLLVSICLLTGRKDLETIASRLTAAARRRDMLDEGAPSLPAGLALYPLDGYSGVELVESARRRYRELRPETPAPAPHAEMTVTQPAGHTPTSRKRSRRRPSRKTHTPQPAA